MSTVLVTGRTSNLGRHLTAQLIDRGHRVRIASYGLTPDHADGVDTFAPFLSGPQNMR